MELLWHKPFAQSWLDRRQHGRLPHAVLLIGPKGLGKRAAAAWIAAQQLQADAHQALPHYPFERPAHADLHWIEPPEDKQAIGIDQIRELVTDLSLTSFHGGGKVAVIDPANAMTISAANSLLKTLEEPPGDTTLILIADRTGRLPATLFSRCQRIDFAPPSEADGLAWLDRLQPGASWLEALRVAGFAPLAAIAAAEELDTSDAMRREFAAVAGGKSSPVAVAGKWSQIDGPFVLDWLARQVRLVILSAAGGRSRAAGIAIDDSVLERMDRRNLFCYLDNVNRLRGQPTGSFNVQLTLESLLIDWAGDLQDCNVSSKLSSLIMEPTVR